MIFIRPKKWAITPGQGSLNVSHPRANGLVGYWPYIGTGGPQSIDLVKGVRNAAQRGATGTQPFYGPSPFGLAYTSPTNTNASITSIPLDTAYDSTTFTAECWARLDVLPAASGSGAFGKWSGGTGWILVCNSGSSVIRFFGDSNALLGPTLTLGIWYHLCGTYDGTTKRLYVNGQEAANAVATMTPNVSQHMNIGTYADLSDVWGGSVALCAFWNRALTASEIWNSYNDPLGMIAPFRSIVSIASSSSSSGGLFRQGNLSGLGSGGHFFQNPIG